jgi:RNA polymerase sigma factor (sigma-70 family)
MLKLAKPINRNVPSCHEEVFVQQYDRLLEKALRMTQGDRVAAEDLVQEAFVQFTFARPDLDSIQFLDAYLYGMMRNLRLMDLRRATHSRSEPLALIDFDSVEIGLRSRDLSQVMQTKNELALICRYACQRKRTSKAGSVLILRFFHGYYPSEISQVIQSSRPVVSELLQVGRNEAHRFTEDPRSLSFLGTPDNHDDSIEAGLSYAEILGGLRRSIFRSRTGPCLSISELEAIYRVSRREPVDVEVLDHLVSCHQCLDSVNAMLNLPLLADRNPTDMLSPNKEKKGGGGSDGPGDPTGGSANLEEIRQKCRRRARSVFEHEPRELCVSVNGDRQYWQKIASATSEQTFSLEPTDDIKLIEISSEQGIRLLMLQVEAAAEQSGEVALSGGRMLRVSFDKSNSRPLLRVCYENPNYLGETYQAADTPPQIETIGWRERLKGSLASVFSGMAIPKVATAIVLLALIVGFLLYKGHKPTELVRVPLAEDLLQRSASAEQAFLTRTDTVLHRSIKVDRRELTASRQQDQTSVHKIEIWRSAEKGLTTRRLFDQQDRLVAGLWQRSDGVQTFYQHGKVPELKLAAKNQQPISLATFWQEEPTAETFKRIVGAEDDKLLTVEELASTYLISYAARSVGDAPVVKASVVLAKADLHVTEMTVVVNEEVASAKSAPSKRLVEYHFIESSFERHSPSTVPSSTFEPEKDLLAAEPSRVSNATPVTPAANAPTVRRVATPDLEVELLRLLHEARADLGEQITVTRTHDGLLRVSGVVETEERKTEILSTIRPVIDTHAVSVDLQTVAEALKQPATPAPDTTPPTLELSISTEAATMPVENDLRKYFEREGDRAGELSQQFAMRMITRSRKSMTHIYALKRLLRQFSAAEFKELSVDAKVKWLALLQAHARAYKSEADLMRAELQPVFFAGHASRSTDAPSQGDAMSAIANAEQLVNLATANDRIVRYSFTTSSEVSSQQTIKSREFLDAMEQATRLAAQIVGSSL